MTTRARRKEGTMVRKEGRRKKEKRKERKRKGRRFFGTSVKERSQNFLRSVTIFFFFFLFFFSIFFSISFYCCFSSLSLSLIKYILILILIIYNIIETVSFSLFTAEKDLWIRNLSHQFELNFLRTSLLE